MRNPVDVNKALLDKVKNAIETSYNVVEGTNRSLHVNNVHFDTLLDTDDYKQHKILLNEGKSAGVSIYADLELKNKHGDILDQRQSTKIGFLPTITNRNTFLVGSKEYSTHHMMRLKPGIYTKEDRNGLPVADFNLEKGRNLSITYMPSKQMLVMEIGSTSIPVIHVLKDVYNTSNKAIESYLGKDMTALEVSHYSASSKEKYLKRLYKSLVSDTVIPLDKIPDAIIKAFNNTVMEAENNKLTIGVPFSHVNMEAILHASKEVMEIYKGKKDPTGKDHLAFKNILGVEDFIHESLTKNSKLVKAKLKAPLLNADKITKLGFSRHINSLIDNYFKSSDTSNYTTQTNIMETLENARKITPLGEGGIGDINALPTTSRKIDISHIGFIDPVRTPDNIKAGVDLRTSITTIKEGNTIKTLVYDKNKQIKYITPKELYGHVYTYLEETPDPLGYYTAYLKNKEIKVKKDKIEYYFHTPAQFTVSTANIPFLENTHAQRAAMGAKMHTQSLSLIDREAPIITTKIIQDTGIDTAYIPKAKVSGKISTMTPDTIHIIDKDNKTHVHNVPNEFPLNYKSYLHFTPKVKVGDTVKQGDLLGDHNYSKNGKLALGINLNVAFLPYKGYNYEDAIVVTEQGAKKLSSEQIYQEEIDIKNLEVGKNKFKAYYPEKYTSVQLAKCDDGVIRKGESVHFGDPLILALKKKDISPKVIEKQSIISRILNPYSDVSLKWENDYPGIVQDVIKTAYKLKVIVKAITPLQVSDKLANRFGGKGVVSLILNDKEAPRNAKGEIPDIIVNPAGISSRKNIGQLHETVLAKIAKAKGIDSIEHTHFGLMNTFDDIKQLADKSKIPITEDLVDPKTGRTLKGVLTGTQYFLKLFKQGETNYSARAGGKYDIDLKPVRGGAEGAKAIGGLDFYAYLGHKGGSKHLLREAATYKSEYTPEYWAAVLQGKPLPAPKVPFAFEKLIAMKKGAGIDVEKEGNVFKLLPMTDKKIKDMSKGEIRNGNTVMLKKDPATGLPFQPEKGGIFDPKLTGGLNGTNWNHIELEVPLPNALHEKTIRNLLDLTKEKYENIIKHKDTLGNYGTGSTAMYEALKDIHIDDTLQDLTHKYNTTKSIAKKDSILKKLKPLRTLKDLNMSPHEAYMNKLMPIIPPKFRPIYPKDDGSVVSSDSNALYKNLIRANEVMQGPAVKALQELHPEWGNLNYNLYNAVKKVQGIDSSSTKVAKANEREPKGFLEVITGNRAKEGFFQSKLLSRVQDIVGSATASVDPSYGIDDIGMPEHMAWKMYGPHVIGRMSKMGFPLEKALKEVNDQSKIAKNLLDVEMQSRPIIINRAPSLHRFNMMAFNPKLVAGKAIKIAPLIVKGFNLDFDGDRVTIHMPQSPEAIKDAYNMLPSKNLFSDLDRTPMHTPGQETIMGLHLATTPREGGKVHTYNTAHEAIADYNSGKIGLRDVVNIKQ